MIGEIYFVVVLDNKDQVIDRYCFDLYPTSDQIMECLKSNNLLGQIGLSAKIDKRYVFKGDVLEVKLQRFGSIVSETLRYPIKE